MSFFSSGSSSSTNVELSDYAQRYLNPLYDQAADAFHQGSPGYYDFNPVAGLNPYTQQGLDSLATQANPSGELGQFGSGALPLLDQYYGNSVASPQITNDSIGNFYNSDLVNNQVGAATGTAHQFLDRYLGNDIASGAAATGNTGSSRRGVMEGRAIADTATGLANTVAGIQDNAYSRAIDTAGANAGFTAGTNSLNAQNIANYGNLATSAIPTAFNLGVSGSNNQISAGNALRGFDQENINAQKDEHFFDYSQQWDLLNRYAGITSPLHNLTNTTTNTSSSPSGFQNALSVGTAAAGIYGGIPTGVGVPTGGGLPAGGINIQDNLQQFGVGGFTPSYTPPF